jgi:signal transduction histidine kinase
LKFRVFSIRWKIIFLFAAAILLASMCVTVLIRLAQNLGQSNRHGFLYNLLQGLKSSIGVFPLSVLAVLALFLLFFFLLSRESILYMEEISRALHQISRGNFDIKIRQGSSDELGELGENLKTMAARLKQLMAEERAAERSKNELITSVSHDLRTPLTSIIGYLELIEKDTGSDMDGLRRNAGIAYQKSLQLKKLIDDLFEYTKVRQGGLSLKPARLDLKELLGQLAEEFVPVFQAAEMACRMKLPEEDCFVMADGDLIVRVFENLISNAVRYGRAGKYVDLEVTRSENWISSAVFNYGHPIPPRDLSRIFERFYRVEGSRSEQAGGSGLGLAIAKSIVDLHHGTINARSDADRTVFEVRLKNAP